jgi:hypothetical protein
MCYLLGDNRKQIKSPWIILKMDEKRKEIHEVEKQYMDVMWGIHYKRRQKKKQSTATAGAAT